MIRLPFTVSVEGIGEFTFRHAALGDQLRIEGRAERMLGGPVEDKELRGWALMVARLEVLTEAVPTGWDLADMDPDDPNTVARILLVHGRLREEQARFRAATAPGKPVSAGEGTQPDGGIPVPEAVQPPPK